MGFLKKMLPQRHCKINRVLLPVKLHYFIFMAALAAALPFRTVFCKQLGVGATAVGVIFTAVPLAKLFANPIIGAILDYFKRFRLTLAFIILVVASSHLAMVFVPPRDIPEDKFNIVANLSCNSTNPRIVFPCLKHSDKSVFTDNLQSCSIICEVCFKPSSSISFDNNYDCSSPCDSDMIEPNLLNLTLDISSKIPEGVEISNKNLNISRTFGHNVLRDGLRPCSKQLRCFSENCDSQLRDCTANCDDSPAKDDGVYSSMQFWVLLLLMCVSSVSFSAVIFIMDAVCYEILNNEPHKFGQQRLWGTAGWGLGALAGGYLNQLVTGSSTDINYAPGFYLLVGVTILDLWPLMRVEVRNVKYSPNILIDVGKLLCKLPVLFNIIMVFFTGALSGLIWNYQFWFMEEIGSSQLLLGLSQTVECFIAEIPCFLIAGWVIRKLGHWNCMSLTFACFGLRYLCLSYMKNPWLTLPVGLLQGPTFGLFYSSMTMFAKTEAPPGTEATVQALLSVAFEGIGAAVGSVIGGIGFDSVGSRNTFLYAGASSFVLLVVNIVIHLFLLYSGKSDSSSKLGEETSSEGTV